MAKKLDVTHDVLKFLDRQDPKQFKQIVSKIFDLTQEATPQDAILMKSSPYYRVNQGEFRIVYRFDEETLFIVIVERRNDDAVYKKIKRKAKSPKAGE